MSFAGATEKERTMKCFLIKYQLRNGSEEEWHRHIAQFISALNNDAGLKGKITYRCMKRPGGSDYLHLATVVDDGVVKTLQSRDFFKHYTEQTKLAGGGQVEVLPFEIVAETEAPLQLKT
jgi:hypothetical protein